MKKLAAALIVFIFVLAGCSGINLTDEKTHQVLAYGAGKWTAIGINEKRPEVDADLTNAWVEMRDRNEGKTEVSGLEMVAFYNDCLRIITGGEFDKYGLIGDLSMLMSIYGGEVNKTTGQMTFIKPVPMVVLMVFEAGYANGRALALR